MAFAPGAFAQDYPNRNIVLVAPFPPGGPSDTTARMIIGPMSQALGQQIIVENVTGAGGTIGTNKVAKAKPDGYTIMVSGSGTHAAAEFLNKNLPYRSTDFEQIGLINVSPVVLVARAGVPANKLKDFVAYLKANEKKVTEADAGVGSISNLACSVFHSVADVHPTVASYRGTPQATMDLVAGTVDFGCNQIVNIVPHIKTGKLKAFAVTGDKRSPMLPDVPTTDGSRPAAIQSHGLVRPVGAQGHAEAGRRQAQQGAWRRAQRSQRGQALRRSWATTWCRRTSAAPNISTSSTRTKSRSGPRCWAVWAWAPNSE